MRIRYKGLRRGTFHVPGKVSGRSYYFSAASLKEQDIDDRDASVFLNRDEFEVVLEHHSSVAPAPLSPQPVTPPPVVAAAIPEPAIQAPQPVLLPPSERPKPTAQALREFEAKAVPEVASWPMDDFAALLGVKQEVSDVLQAAGLFKLADLEAASDEELLAIKGVGKRMLKVIRQALKDAAE